MFTAQVCGKFILTGEHSVLRGGAALAFPLRSKSLELKYEDRGDELQFASLGPVGNMELNLVFWSLLERALNLAHRKRSDVRGRLIIENSIPLASGLGASAALCVAIAKWFNHLGFVQSQNMFEFARSLEDLFHGESSGVDVAVTLANEPILFRRGQSPSKLLNRLQPKLFLCSTHHSGKTSECIQKVKDLIKRNPAIGNDIDQEMERSTQLALKAIGETGDSALKTLADSMVKARSCFERWGLTDGFHEQLAKLMEAGALAVKPTGSGGGGYILSLWKSDPQLPGLFPV